MTEKEKKDVTNAVTEKYFMKLKQLMVDVPNHGFATAKWMVKNKLDNHFIEECVNLGYIKPYGKDGARTIYVPAYEADEITMQMALGLQMKIRETVRTLKKKAVEKTEILQPVYEKVQVANLEAVEKIVQLGLETFTSSELVDELKNRGFTGMIEKLEKFEF